MRVPPFVKALFDLFFDVCLLRRGPQDLPASTGLLRLALGVYVIAALALALVGADFGRATIQVALDVAITLAVFHFLLFWRGHPERAVQTLTAVFGSSALLTGVGLPLLIWLGRHIDADGKVGPGGDLPSFLWFLLFIWSLLVTGHILRHALNMRLGAAVLVAGAYTFGDIALVGYLLPSATH